MSDCSNSDKYTERPFIVAGPCSAESRDQLLEVAAALQPLSIDCFRAGAWKPRTRPGLFEGHGEKALQWMQEVQQEFGLRVGTEVCTPQHVELALQYGLDMLWVGARTSSSPFAVSEIAQALQGTSVEVLVKNPISPDAALWAGAIDRLRAVGIADIKAVFRGCTPLSSSARFRNFPYWRLVALLRAELPEIPVLCDPSHITGARSRVADLCLVAREMGMEGLMVECHQYPEKALSDAAQQITPEQLQEILCTLQHRSSLSSSEQESMVGLARYRALLADVDQAMFELLVQRMNLTAQIARYKREHGLSALQPEQYNHVLQQCRNMAELEGLDAEFVCELYERVHQESVRHQSLEIEKKKE